ncbi:hypothetical protein Poli38472_005009 [Pythium oligandrum]|uniref:PLAC8 family protein n=1 Tax=Pythium oligandrum TaxID=41045 RepID=A0A8K1FDY7_PYTOL|nr:hypothetical protein Poli38472_005009 [Pythium oligandrum]|eukprot:TMW59940.1 hypothetical protein Poli38472_005009 [Pythium oligandrum]
MSFNPPAKGYSKKDDDLMNVSSTPAAQGVDHNGIVVGRWKSGIFGCTDSLVPNACMAFFCPAISVAQICARLGLARFYYVLVGFALLYLLALIAAITKNAVMDGIVVIISFATAFLIARLRWRVRYLFSLPGSGLEDCIYAMFCGCCTISQMATQVESYTPGSCHFAPRNTLEGYTFA